MSDKLKESQLFDIRDKILADHGVEVHARGHKRKTLEKAKKEEGESKQRKNNVVEEPKTPDESATQIAK
eukprot:6637311-Karenia_brevis.AAC.1